MASASKVGSSFIAESFLLASDVFFSVSISCNNKFISFWIDGASARSCKSFASILDNNGSDASSLYILLLLSSALSKLSSVNKYKYLA